MCIRNDDDEYKNGSRDHDRGGCHPRQQTCLVLLNSDVGYIDTIPPTSDGNGHASSLVVLFVIWIDKEKNTIKVMVALQ